MQQPDQRRGAVTQLRQAAGFDEVRDVLQWVMAAAEGLRQPALPGPASPPAASAPAPSALSWDDAAEGSAAQACWPDAVAAAAAAPCAAAYWARSVHSELGVQHWAQRLRCVAARAAAAQQELARRRTTTAGAEPTDSAAATAQARLAAEPPAAQLAAGPEGSAGTAAEDTCGASASSTGGAQGQGHESGQLDGEVVLADLAEEALELLLGLALEEGALALAHVHSPLAGERCHDRQRQRGLGTGLRLMWEPEVEATWAAWHKGSLAYSVLILPLLSALQTCAGWGRPSMIWAGSSGTGCRPKASGGLKGQLQAMPTLPVQPRHGVLRLLAAGWPLPAS